MAERYDLLEERVAALSRTVAALESRLAVLEDGRLPEPDGAGRRAGPEDAAPPVAADAAAPLEGPGPVVLAGRAFLGLGGAYLVRALTDAGTIPPLAGVLAGLVYAAAWIVASDRSGRSGRAVEAAVHGALALVIALPLLWEATARLRVVEPAAAAALLAAVGAAAFAVAWRRSLALLAWAATLGSIGTAWALLLATSRIELFTVLLVAFGAATLWTTYGRRWHALRWPAALGADLAVLALTFLGTRPGGPPEAYGALRPGRAAFVALLLFVVYVGSFAARTLARRREVNVFEVAQTAAALVVGYGGAVRLARVAETGESALGIAALVLAALGYGAAFGFVDRDSAGAGNFLFFSSLALVLALTGGSLLATGPALGLAWAGFGLAAAILGSRFGRRSLVAHAAIFLVAAGIPAGLYRGALDAFGGSPAEGAGAPLGAAAAGVAIAAGLAWGMNRGRRPEGWGVPCVAPALLLAVAAAGSGAFAVLLLDRLLPGGPAPVRTVVLAGAAVLLAALASRLGAAEARSLAWIVLGFATVKLLVKDLPGGAPATLFTAFVLYGLSLLAVSRLLGRAAPRGA